MGKKRGVGERSQIYFDSIDLEIMEFLNEKNYKTHEGAYSIFDIIDKIKINSKSLKPHIDKLLTLGLIETTTMFYAGNIRGCEDDLKYEGKGGLTTPTISFQFFNDIDYYSDVTEDVFKEHKKKSEDFEKLLIELRKVRTYYWTEKQKKNIYIDLRSKETIKNFSKLKNLKPIGNISKARIEKMNKESELLTEQEHKKQNKK